MNFIRFGEQVVNLEEITHVQLASNCYPNSDYNNPTPCVRIYFKNKEQVVIYEEYDKTREFFQEQVASYI